MKRTFFSVFIMAMAFIAANSVSYAQGTPTSAELDKNMELMRTDLRSAKKQVIAANISLTDVEATKFWPVYDQYVADMRKQNDQFYIVIKEYAANQATLTDAQALDLIKRWSNIQGEMVKVRQKYIPLFAKAISGKKTALFYQIDRRLFLLMDLQVASEIPLVMEP